MKDEIATKSSRRKFLKGIKLTAVTGAAGAFGIRTQSSLLETLQSDQSDTMSNRVNLLKFKKIADDENFRVVRKPGGSGTAIEVRIPEGSHYGTSLEFPFEEQRFREPSAIRARYDIYFPTDLTISERGGKLPGAGGLYTNEPWGAARPVFDPDGTNGWFAYGSHYEGEAPQTSRLGYYVYHANSSPPFGDHYVWNTDLEWGTWHRIEQEIELNTPGKSNGILRGQVDGENVFEKTDFVFREAGYDRIMIEKYWFLVYWGGTWTSPADNSIYFDNFLLEW